MSRINERRAEILAKARARKAEIARTAPSENTLHRRDQVRRAKSLLREFILDHGIEIKDAGRALGYESVARLPRHLLQGMVTLEDLLAMTEFFEDFDPTAILRDVVLGVDEHPDEAKARREGTITPDGERVVLDTPAPQEEPEVTPLASSAPSAPSPQEEEQEEIVIVQPDASPQEDDEPSLDTDEGLRAWANRFGFAM